MLEAHGTISTPKTTGHFFLSVSCLVACVDLRLQGLPDAWLDESLRDGRLSQPQRDLEDDGSEVVELFAMASSADWGECGITFVAHANCLASSWHGNHSAWLAVPKQHGCVGSLAAPEFEASASSSHVDAVRLPSSSWSSIWAAAASTLRRRSGWDPSPSSRGECSEGPSPCGLSSF